MDAIQQLAPRVAVLFVAMLVGGSVLAGSADARSGENSDLHAPPGSIDDPNVDKYTGSVRFSLPLGSLADDSGPGYDLVLSYNSRVHSTFRTWNREVDTGVAGLGWNVPGMRIIRFTRDTAITSDDSYVLFDHGEKYELKYESEAADGTKTYSIIGPWKNWAVAYSPGSDEDYGQWIVVKEDGTRYELGGSARDGGARDSDGNGLLESLCALIEDAPGREEVASEHPHNRNADRCDSGSVAVGIVWHDRMGVSVTAAGQRELELSWHLSAIVNRWNARTTFHYARHQQNVGKQASAKAFTKRVYLYMIRNPSGRAIVINYGPKTGFGGSTPWKEPSPGGDDGRAGAGDLTTCGGGSTVRPYGEYYDPWTVNLEPDGYQEVYSVLYIDSVDQVLHSETSATGVQALERVQLEYCFLQGVTFPGTEGGDPPGYDPQLAKRAIAAIHHQSTRPSAANRGFMDARPPYRFEYFDGSHEGFAGAVRSISEPSGLVKEYEYSPVVLEATERRVSVDADSGVRDRIPFRAPGYSFVAGKSVPFEQDVGFSFRWTATGWDVQEFDFTEAGGADGAQRALSDDVRGLEYRRLRHAAFSQNHFIKYDNGVGKAFLVVRDRTTGRWKDPVELDLGFDLGSALDRQYVQVVSQERFVAAFDIAGGNVVVFTTDDEWTTWRRDERKEFIKPAKGFLPPDNGRDEVQDSVMRATSNGIFVASSHVGTSTEGVEDSCDERLLSYYKESLEVRSLLIDEQGQWLAGEKAERKLNNRVCRWHDSASNTQYYQLELSVAENRLIAYSSLRPDSDKANQFITWASILFVDPSTGGVSGNMNAPAHYSDVSKAACHEITGAHENPIQVVSDINSSIAVSGTGFAITASGTRGCSNGTTVVFYSCDIYSYDPGKNEYNFDLNVYFKDKDSDKDAGDPKCGLGAAAFNGMYGISSNHGGNTQSPKNYYFQDPESDWGIRDSENSPKWDAGNVTLVNQKALTALKTIEEIFQVISIAVLPLSLTSPEGIAMAVMAAAQIGVGEALKKLPSERFSTTSPGLTDMSRHYVVDGDQMYYREADGSLRMGGEIWDPGELGMSTLADFELAYHTHRAGAGYHPISVRSGDDYKLFVREMKNGVFGDPSEVAWSGMGASQVVGSVGDQLSLIENTHFMTYDRSKEGSFGCRSLVSGVDDSDKPCFFTNYGAFNMFRITADGGATGSPTDYPVTKVTFSDGETRYVSEYDYESASAVYSDQNMGGHYARVTVYLGGRESGDGAIAYRYLNGHDHALKYEVVQPDGSRTQLSAKEIGYRFAGLLLSSRVMRAGQDEPVEVSAVTPVLDASDPRRISQRIETEVRTRDAVSVETDYVYNELRQVRGSAVTTKLWNTAAGKVEKETLANTVSYAHEQEAYGEFKALNILSWPFRLDTERSIDGGPGHVVAATALTYDNWDESKGALWALKCRYSSLAIDPGDAPAQAGDGCAASEDWRLDEEVLARDPRNGAVNDRADTYGLRTQTWRSTGTDTRPYAIFTNLEANAPVSGTGNAGYWGAEDYEHEVFDLGDGVEPTSDYVYSGRRALRFQADGAVSPLAGSYTAPRTAPAVMGAWVRMLEGKSCTIGFSAEDEQTWRGADGDVDIERTRWRYIQRISATVDDIEAPTLSCDEGVYADDLAYGAVDGTWSVTVHDIGDGLVDATLGTDGANSHHVYDDWARPYIVYDDFNDDSGSTNRRIRDYRTSGWGRFSGFSRPPDPDEAAAPGGACSAPRERDAAPAGAGDSPAAGGRGASSRFQHNTALQLAFQSAHDMRYLPAIELNGEDSSLGDVGSHFAMVMLGFDAVGADAHLKIGTGDPDSDILVAYDDEKKCFAIRQESSRTEVYSETLPRAPYEVGVVGLGRTLAVIADGRVVATAHNRLDAPPDDARIDNHDLTMKEIVFGKMPLISLVQRDGRGNVVQAVEPRAEYEADGEESLDLSAAVTGALYDGYGNLAASTRAAASAQCTFVDPAAAPFSYCQDFISAFDWRQEGDGAMDGVIRDYWAEHKPSQSADEDEGYAFDRHIVYPSALGRAKEATVAPGEVYGALSQAGSRSARGELSTRFEYQGEHGAALKDAVGIAESDAADFATSTTDRAFSGGSGGRRTVRTKLEDASGRLAVARAGNETDGQSYFGKTREYNVENSGQAGAARPDEGAVSPVRTTTHFPEAFTADGGTPGSGHRLAVERLDPAGTVVVTEESDVDGVEFRFSDRRGRVRFAQLDPQWDEESHGFQYWKYDLLGRVIEEGVLMDVGAPNTQAFYRDKALNDPSWPDEEKDKCVVVTYLYDYARSDPTGSGDVLNLLNGQGRLFAAVRDEAGVADRPQGGSCAATAESGEKNVIVDYRRYDQWGRIAVRAVDVHGGADDPGDSVPEGIYEVKWERSGSTTSRLIAADIDHCLGAGEDGATVTVAACSDAASQQWTRAFFGDDHDRVGHVIESGGPGNRCLVGSVDGVSLSACDGEPSDSQGWIRISENNSVQHAGLGLCPKIVSEYPDVQIVLDESCGAGTTYEWVPLTGSTGQIKWSDDNFCLRRSFDSSGYYLSSQACDPGNDEHVVRHETSGGQSSHLMRLGDGGALGDNCLGVDLAKGNSPVKLMSCLDPISTDVQRTWSITGEGLVSLLKNPDLCLGQFGRDYYTVGACKGFVRAGARGQESASGPDILRLVRAGESQSPLRSVIDADKCLWTEQSSQPGLDYTLGDHCGISGFSIGLAIEGFNDARGYRLGSNNNPYICMSQEDGRLVSKACQSSGSGPIPAAELWMPIARHGRVQSLLTGDCVEAKSDTEVSADGDCGANWQVLWMPLEGSTGQLVRTSDGACVVSRGDNTPVETATCNPSASNQVFQYDAEAGIIRTGGLNLVWGHEARTGRYDSRVVMTGNPPHGEWIVEESGVVRSNFNKQLCLGSFGGSSIDVASCIPMLSGRTLRHRRNTGYEYDNRGNTVALTYPDIERSDSEPLFELSDQYRVSYRYGFTGDLNAIADATSRFSAARQYDVEGNLVRELLDDGRMERTYKFDFQSRLTGIAVADTGDESIVFQQDLAYQDTPDAADGYQANQIVGVRYQGSGLQGAGHDWRYEYDVWGRLISAIRTGHDAATYVYTLDRNGNLLTMTRSGGDRPFSRRFDYHDGSNRVAGWNEDGAEHGIGHDGRGAVTSVDVPGVGALVIRREAKSGRPLCFETSDGGVVRYSHDARGALIARSFAGAGTCGAGTAR